MNEQAAPLLAALQALRRDYFFWALLGVFALLTLAAPGAGSPLPRAGGLADHCAFTGLLVLTKGVQLSGYLHHLGERLIAAMPTERALALFLVLAAALLSTLLTNDVALFVMVPLTSSLRAMSAVPVTRLIVFEALAVNAGSALTPLRNPQNLFLWQLSHTSFRQYVAAMLPLAIILLIPLLLLTAWTFSGSSIPIKGDNHQPPRRNGLLYLSLALYLPFLVLADRHHAELAVTLVVAILRAQAMPALPKVLRQQQHWSSSDLTFRLNDCSPSARIS